MSNCRSCGHERLLHDSWGCMTRCGCAVSIIYLTAPPFSAPPDQVVEVELIRQGNALVLEADRLEESHIRAMRDRSIAEIEPR